jgi:hypothetical protein
MGLRTYFYSIQFIQYNNAVTLEDNSTVKQFCDRFRGLESGTLSERINPDGQLRRGTAPPGLLGYDILLP